MVTNDSSTQDAERLGALSRSYGIPILSIHAPRAARDAVGLGHRPGQKSSTGRPSWREAVGAQTVVVHPPFRWQAAYSRRFEAVVGELADQYGVEVAVENMFTWTIGGQGRARLLAEPVPDRPRRAVDDARLLPRGARRPRRPRVRPRDGREAAPHPPVRRTRRHDLRRVTSSPATARSRSPRFSACSRTRAGAAQSSQRCTPTRRAPPRHDSRWLGETLAFARAALANSPHTVKNAKPRGQEAQIDLELTARPRWPK
ncbi:MAG: hypothetical protein WDM88_10425 [Galbitalea sp.]